MQEGNGDEKEISVWYSYSLAPIAFHVLSAQSYRRGATLIHLVSVFFCLCQHLKGTLCLPIFFANVLVLGINFYAHR